MLIGLDNPLDQYYMRHPDVLLGKPSEHAVDNVYILSVTCRARARSPLQADEAGRTTERSSAQASSMRWSGWSARHAAVHGRKMGLRAGDYHAETISLRGAEGDRFAVLGLGNQYKASRGAERHDLRPRRVHPGAVYLHQGRAYLVTEYNGDLRHAIVQQSQVDYYTQRRELNDLRIVRSVRRERRGPGLPGPGAGAVTRSSAIAASAFH